MELPQLQNMGYLPLAPQTWGSQASERARPLTDMGTRVYNSPAEQLDTHRDSLRNAAGHRRQAGVPREDHAPPLHTWGRPSPHLHSPVPRKSNAPSTGVIGNILSPMNY